ncbi:hypothetical protein B0H14DRAFT_3496946 [Mycena olivaceomarginata]|nr:hypothetical protein B0H14DRAFT_3496946 [Mycena olivaceomarginata]
MSFELAIVLRRWPFLLILLFLAPDIPTRRRVHVQSSSIPTESSSSRITPTDQPRAPVFGNTERESRRRPAVTADFLHPGLDQLVYLIATEVLPYTEAKMQIFESDYRPGRAKTTYTMA